MIDNLSGPTARINQSLDQTIGRLERAEQGFSDMTKSGMAMGLLGKELASVALSPVEATFETKKALGELSSVGIQDLKALEQAGKQFSDTWAGTTKADFIAAAYDIKSGISTLSDTSVAEYTKIAGITAKGTKSSIDEMTSLFATGYGIYKKYYSEMSDLEFGEMFSAGISLAVERYKTKGSEMASSIQTLGAAATSAQVPLEEQLSILGTLQRSMSGSEAGTKYKAFLKSAAKAGDELGLSFLDANNQLRSMPEIIAELQGKYGDTVDAIEKMELQDAFGTQEAVDLISLLYDQTDLLQSSIVDMYDSMGQGIDVAKLMADAINQTEGEQYELLKQKIHNVKEEIGNQLLPTFMDMLNKGFEILSWLSKWIDENQTAVKWIMHIVLALGTALMVFGAFNLVVGGAGLVVTKTIGNFKKLAGAIRGIPSLFETMQIRAMYAGDAIKNGFTSIKTFASSAVTGIKSVATSIIQMGKAAIINGANAIKQMVLGMVNMARQAVVTAVQAMPGLIASVWSFTAALLANPITWVIIGIVALIAALVLLWQNWDSVVSFLTGVWNAAVEGVIGAFNWIKEKVASMPNGFVALIAAIFPFIGIPMLIFKNWGKIKAFFSDIWNGIKTGFTNFFTNFLPNVLNSGKKIMETLASGIKKTISAPVDMVKSGLSKIRKLLPFSDAKEGPLSTLTLSGKRVFETINTGMMKTKHLPAETTKEAFKGIDLNYEDATEGNDYSMEPRKVEKVSLREISKEREAQYKEESTKEKNEGTKQYININVDIEKIKELPLLVKLLKEIEDYNNSNNPEPSNA
ncbi:phage tail tape measure protein [Anaerovorax sp. IOR16]|uniref:phage tail tape measure protein n=1 Tax=Anaerovorax sp. IOR16 TaxID=2773458 RepID=UPI001AD8EB8D|nr:phage tail tape measure protein [Anaerovorax sp. IOR16]